MPDTRDPEVVIVAAEQAAAAGDYASAERFLREAALLQEATLGALHPDLANTLNNLGVVCEITDNPIDAEHYFRRACAIASAVLPHDHPFVATSRKNLEDFCSARGRKVALPGVSFTPDRGAGTTASDLLPSRASSHEESPPIASASSTRPLTIAALVSAGLLLMVAAAASWFRSNDTTQPSPPRSTAAASSRRATAAGSNLAPAERDVADEKRKESRAGGGRSTRGVTDTPASSNAQAVATSSGAVVEAARPARHMPVVAAAQLCNRLSTGRSSGDWQCSSAGESIASGSVFFYTRLKSPSAVTVQHRWYRGDRLHRVVELAIRANNVNGYRTYSRSTVDGPGDWRVELRTKDGVLLHEERFVVR
jgi:hypothetical protein